MKKLIDVDYVRTDCFAYDEAHKKCECLNKLYCKTEDCHFYKSKEEITLKELEDAINNYKG